MTATLIRPAPGRLPQRTRRRLVLAAIGLAATGLIGVSLAPPGSLTASLIKLTVALSSLVAFALVMLRSHVWFLGNAPDTALDEREIAVRNRAYFKAYGVFASLALASAFYLLDLGPDLGLPIPGAYDTWWAIAWGFLMLGLGLPAGFVAWDLPDPVSDLEP